MALSLRSGPAARRVGIDHPEGRGDGVEAPVPHSLLALGDQLGRLGVVDEAAAGEAAGHGVDEGADPGGVEEVEDPGGDGDQAAGGVDLVHPAVIGQGEGQFALARPHPGAPQPEDLGEVEGVDARPAVLGADIADITDQAIESAAQIDDGGRRAGAEVCGGSR